MLFVHKQKKISYTLHSSFLLILPILKQGWGSVKYFSLKKGSTDEKVWKALIQINTKINLLRNEKIRQFNYLKELFNIKKFCNKLWNLRFSRRWEWCSSGFWHRVDSSVDGNVSETHTVSIFRAENGDSMFLRNVVIYRWVYAVPKSRTTLSSITSCLLIYIATSTWLKLYTICFVSLTMLLVLRYSLQVCMAGAAVSRLTNSVR
jgi:hypothetical protein